MNPEKHSPARRPAMALAASLSLLLLLVLAGAPEASAQDERAADRAKEPNVADLLRMPGKVIAEGASERAAGAARVRGYRVEELTLPEAVTAEVRGRRVETARAFRVTLTGGPFPVRALPAVVWIDDAAVGYGVESEDLDAVTAVTFDDSLVRDGATLYLSYGDKENKQDRTAVPARLKLGAAKGGDQ